MNGRFVSVVQWCAHVHATLQPQVCWQLRPPLGFRMRGTPPLGCARASPSHFRRANKSARGGFNSRALHSRPGIRISYACACAHGVSLPPSPPKLIPSPARAGSSRPPRREHTRRSPAIPVRVAPRACCCAVLGCIACAPTCACGSGCQAARECEALGPRRAFAGAAAVRWPRAHAARRAAKNPGLATPAQLRLQWGVARHRITETNRPSI